MTEQEQANQVQDTVEELMDKVEGLSADLDAAIEVAYNRGARDWVALNYPTHYERLEKKRQTKPLLDLKDCVIHTYRSGVNSSWVNTADSAVLIVHLPTGLKAFSDTFRGQHRNRHAALEKLTELVESQLKVTAIVEQLTVDPQ